MSVVGKRHPGFYDCRDYGSIAATITAAQNTVNTGVQGATIYIPGTQEWVITDTLDLTRFHGRIYGDGTGISAAYTADPGRGSVIRWNGSAGSPMIRVRDSRHVILEGFRLEGKDSAVPSYGIEFNNNGGTNGSNEYMTVRDVFIGKYTWSSQGTTKGQVGTGIGWTGTNGNNDQTRIERVEVYEPATYGFYLPNSQSVGVTFRNPTVYKPGSAAIYTAASIRIDDPEFYYGNPDIETATGAVTVIVDNIKSEFSYKLANIHNNVLLAIRGGNFQCGNIISGSGVMIDAYPSGAQVIHLEDMSFTGMTNAAACTWDFGPDNAVNVGNFHYTVKNCSGLEPAQLNLLGTFWASSPISKGTIEWESRVTDKRYHFRNELRKNGRETVSSVVWDAPLNSTSTSADTFAPTQIVMGYVSKSATYTATVADQVIAMDASGAARTVNLPTATAYVGKTYTIKKIDNSANAVTVDANGTETIDGALTYALATQWEFVTVMSDGANWLVIGND